MIRPRATSGAPRVVRCSERVRRDCRAPVADWAFRPRGRRAAGRDESSTGNILFGVAHADVCFGFAAFRRDRVLSLEFDAVGLEIETQLSLGRLAGLDVVEVASFEAPRSFGTSNLNTFRDRWRVLRTIFAERLRPTTTARIAIPIDAEPVAIPMEPAAYKVASIVSDRAYTLTARSVATRAELLE